MAFEKYIRKLYRRGQSFISVAKNGNLSISVQAYKTFYLSKFRFVFLHYDAETNKIGIEPRLRWEDGCFRITGKMTKRQMKIGAQLFFRHFGLPLPTGKRLQFTPSLSEDGKIVFTYKVEE